MNNRPLGYIENDIQLSALTPNMIFYGKGITIPFKNPGDDNQEFKNKNNDTSIYIYHKMQELGVEKMAERVLNIFRDNDRSKECHKRQKKPLRNSLK